MAALSVGIAGAGIGGLAAAAFLAADGHAVTVFDRFDAPRPVGSGLVIQPVGQEVLNALGLLDTARRAGVAIRRMQGHEARRGRRILDVWYDRSAARRFGLAIHRASLFAILHGAAKAAGAQLRPGHEIVGLDNGPRYRFRLAGGGLTDPFDLAIDAAGARSPLSPLYARPLGYGALWGTVRWPEGTRLPADMLTQRYRRASRMLGVLPVGTLPGDPVLRATIFWSLPAGGYDAWRAAPLAGWQAEAVALWPEFAPFIEQISDHDQMTMARYAHGTLDRPAMPRLAHIGDAAHATSPQLGQGANMALLDAQALAGALRVLPPEAAPAAYARARRRHVRLYQTLSGVFTPLYQSDSRALPVLRDLMLAPLTRLPPSQWLLGHLVRGTLTAPIRRGRTAPTAPAAPAR